MTWRIEFHKMMKVDPLFKDRYFEPLDYLRRSFIDTRLIRRISMANQLRGPNWGPH
jgi:hypothetical protein